MSSIKCALVKGAKIAILVLYEAILRLVIYIMAAIIILQLKANTLLTAILRAFVER